MQYYFIKSCLEAGKLTVNQITGQVFNNGKELKCVSSRGYIVGTVNFNGMRKQVKAHQVVWIANNLSKYWQGLVVDHKNRDKQDNRIHNLRLVTKAGNASNRRNYAGASNPSAVLTEENVRRIRKTSLDGFNSYAGLAKAFNVSKSTIAAIVQRKTWK